VKAGHSSLVSGEEIGETGEAHREALPLELGLDDVGPFHAQGSRPDAPEKDTGSSVAMMNR
jgi:hypothetical protein